MGIVLWYTFHPYNQYSVSSGSGDRVLFAFHQHKYGAGVQCFISNDTLKGLNPALSLKNTISYLRLNECTVHQPLCFTLYYEDLKPWPENSNSAGRREMELRAETVSSLHEQRASVPPSVRPSLPFRRKDGFCRHATNRSFTCVPFLPRCLWTRNTWQEEEGCWC